jgi:two-component system chemotaxis response regulator CheY
MARIMIADDNAGIRSLLQVLIQQDGHQVVAASKNGLEALCDYFEFTPDLAVLDNHMPGITGLDVARHIQKKESTAKIILYTATPKDIEQMTEMVGLKVISKEFSLERLIDEINHSLSK